MFKKKANLICFDFITISGKHKTKLTLDTTFTMMTYYQKRINAGITNVPKCFGSPAYPILKLGASNDFKVMRFTRKQGWNAQSMLN